MGEEDGGDGFVGFLGMVLDGVEGGAGDEDGHEAWCGVVFWARCWGVYWVGLLLLGNGRGG